MHPVRLGQGNIAWQCYINSGYYVLLVSCPSASGCSDIYLRGIPTKWRDEERNSVEIAIMCVVPPTLAVSREVAMTPSSQAGSQLLSKVQWPFLPGLSVDSATGVVVGSRYVESSSIWLTH